MRRKEALLALLLASAALLAYLPALRAGFIWNDDTYVTQNPTLDGASGLRRIWTSPAANEQYYPLVFTTFWIEKSLWGLNPLGYHLVNVLLHAAAALLLGAFLRRLELKGAWLAAFAFALHPACVESVAWVTERKNTLSLVLTLLSLHAWLSFRAATSRNESAPDPPVATAKSRKRAAKPARSSKVTLAPWYRTSGALYAAALLAFTFALLAKTTASVLPAVLLVLVWWNDGRIRGSDVRPLLPFFAIGTALALYTAWFERTTVRAVGEDWALGALGRLVLAGRALWFYAGKVVLPTELAFIYPRWTIDPGDPRQWIPLLSALGVLVALVVTFRSNEDGGRVSRGPLAAALLFGGTLFPALGFFNVYAMRYSYVADHFAYQAIAIAISALACGAASLEAHAGAGLRRVATVVSAAVLLVFGVLTFRECRAYETEETLWQSTIAKNPECFLCETNYGRLLLDQGRTDEAVLHLQRSLEIRPASVPTLLNLGRIEETRERFDEAAKYLEAARRADPEDPVIHLNLATVLLKGGRHQEALAAYQEALRRPSSNDYLVHQGLGALLMRLGQPVEAVEHFRAVVRLRPDYEPGRANLERALDILARTTGRPPAG